jgi:hypothetical protein
MVNRPLAVNYAAVNHSLVKVLTSSSHQAPQGLTPDQPLPSYALSLMKRSPRVSPSDIQNARHIRQAPASS